MNKITHYYWLFGTIILALAGLYLWNEVQITDRIQPDFSPTIHAQHGTLLRVDLNKNDQYNLPLDQTVPSSVKQAIISVEDQRFWYHPGVDPFAVVRAAWQNIKWMEIRSGASTITMQLARMLVPAERTFTHKFQEAIRALVIEARYSKRDILRAYLNRLPMGGNRRGIETGAQYYFDRSAEGLRFDQAAVLVGIPKNPNLYNPNQRPGNALQRRNYALIRMADEFNWNQSTLKTVRGRSLDHGQHPFPHRSPHFTTAVRSQQSVQSFTSSLDINIQHKVNKLTSSYRDSLVNRGIQHLAVVVLDNQTREILGYEGSGDFYNADGGRIQGPLIRRSPGSALKPFLYALGIEKFNLHPRRRLVDVPVRYSDFRPENFDRDFHGLVTVRRALRDSLNIPAVRYLNQIGLQNFYQFLERGGLDFPRDASHYGLGLTLGGAGVSLLDLTNAYASLGDRGRFKQPTWKRTNDVPDSQPWFSPETSYLITDMLGTSHIDALDLPVALKTGTSAGRRDAWTVAFNSRYTVGVWTGNFDYRKSRSLVGRRAAKPLALRIMRSIHTGGEGPSFDKPDGLVKRTVCSVSGQPATPHCPETETTTVPKDQPRGHTCDIHKQVLVSKNSPWSHCAYCRPNQARTAVKEDYPPELHQLMKERGQLTNQAPPHDPNCPYSGSHSTISLIEPGPRSTYWKHNNSKVPVQPTASETGRPLYLFHNDVYVGEIKSGQTHWLTPSKGQHQVTIVDETGRANTQQFTVKVR